MGASGGRRAGGRRELTRWKTRRLAHGDVGREVSQLPTFGGRSARRRLYACRRRRSRRRRRGLRRRCNRVSEKVDDATWQRAV